MVTKLYKSTVQTALAFVAEALFVTIVACIPVCAAVSFAAITGCL
jgi:hypothetical protein